MPCEYTWHVAPSCLTPAYQGQLPLSVSLSALLQSHTVQLKKLQGFGETSKFTLRASPFRSGCGGCG